MVGDATDSSPTRPKSAPQITHGLIYKRKYTATNSPK